MSVREKFVGLVVAFISFMKKESNGPIVAMALVSSA